MAKTFSLPVVQSSLRKVFSEEDAQRALVEMQRLAREEDASKPEKEKPEKKLLTVIRPEDSTEIAWVVAHPESMPPAVVPDKLREAIASYNSSKKGRMSPAASLGQGLELAGAKHFKEFGLAIRTKLPVTMLAMGADVALPSLLKVA